MEECSEEYFPASIHTLEFFPRFVWRLGLVRKAVMRLVEFLGQWVPLGPWGASLRAAVRHSVV